MKDLRQSMDTILLRIQEACVRTGRKPKEVLLVAISKTILPETIRKAYELGQKDFGENQAQQFRDKRIVLQDLTLSWHFVGTLQSNKVKYVVGHAEYIHSVNSLSILRKIDQRAAVCGCVQKVLIEVNVSGEESKHGVCQNEMGVILEHSRSMPNIHVMGFMAMAPFVEDPEEVRWVFRKMKDLQAKWLSEYPSLHHLSMGMSGDFEVAVEEGATMVRVGTALFGAR
jgi:hypothetical protein